jgi:alkaline phosphatase
MKRSFLALLSLLMVLSLCIGCAPSIPQNNASTALGATQATTEEPIIEVPPFSEPVLEGTYLNGVELSEYAIVYSQTELDYNKRAAEYIQAEILARTEVELSIVTDDLPPEAEYEIVVGETTRAISNRLDVETKGTRFAILAEEKQIAMEGDYFVVAAAAYFFVQTYIIEGFNTVVPEGVLLHNPITKKAENYILLIGDGMGVYQTQLFDSVSDTSNLGEQEDRFYGSLFPYQGYARTNSLSGVTDSAAAGTALAAGYKTVNRYVGQDQNQKDIQSLTELAASLGKSTAVMSTDLYTGATPSSFSAHTGDRGNSAEILADQQLLTAQYRTIIKCEYNYYTKQQINTIEGYVTDTLDRLDDNENGFFLMYEEAHIDKHCHNNDMQSTFNAVLRFNQVIARFMEYAFYHPNTFVLITADHETGGLTPNSAGGFSYTSGGHTDQNVPVFAYGDGAELFGGLTVENIQIPQTIAAFWGVKDFGDQSTYQSLKK